MDLLDRGKISGFQFFALLLVIRLVPVTLICPTVNLVSNPATAWINDVIGSVLALPLIWLIVNLSRRNPDKTIIGYAGDLLGPVAGKAAGFLIVLFFFMIAATVLRVLGETLVAGIMLATPILVFIVSSAFLAANITRNGLEIEARLASFLMPIVVLLLVLIVVLAANYMDPQYLRPIFFPGGLTELVWPTASVLSYYTEYLVIGMLVPYLNHPERAMAISAGAVLFTLAILIMQCLALASVFGPLVSSLTMPAFALVQIVSIGPFFERIESLIASIWIFTAGLKLTLFFWASTVGLSQLLRLKSHPPLAYPLAGLMVPVSILSYEGLIELLNVFTESMVVFYIGFLIILLPVLYGALGIRMWKPAKGVKDH